MEGKYYRKQFTANFNILVEQWWQKGYHVNSQWVNDEKNLTTRIFFK